MYPVSPLPVYKYMTPSTMTKRPISSKLYIPLMDIFYVNKLVEYLVHNYIEYKQIRKLREECRDNI